MSRSLWRAGRLGDLTYRLWSVDTLWSYLHGDGGLGVEAAFWYPWFTACILEVGWVSKDMGFVPPIDATNFLYECECGWPSIQCVRLIHSLHWVGVPIFLISASMIHGDLRPLLGVLVLFPPFQQLDLTTDDMNGSLQVGLKCMYLLRSMVVTRDPLLIMNTNTNRPLRLYWLTFAWVQWFALQQ